MRAKVLRGLSALVLLLALLPGEEPTMRCDVCDRDECGATWGGLKTNSPEAAECYSLGYARLREAVEHLAAIIETFNFQGKHPIHHNSYGGCGRCDPLPKLLPLLPRAQDIGLMEIDAE